MSEKSPSYMVGPGGARPVPVKMLRFKTGITVELPKRPAATTVADETMQLGADGVMVERPINIPRYKINYLPWLGMHAISFFQPGEKEPLGKPILIPREWATMEPME